MKYPKVGEKFYWKDSDGNISESYCKRIDKDPEGLIITNYFIYITPNGGGSFITEDEILDSESDEVIKFKKKLCKEKIDKFINEIKNDNDIYHELHTRLNEYFCEKDSTKILNIIIGNKYV